MLSVCSLVALFGFIVEFFGLNTLGLIPKTHYRGWLTGTFVNRNSAASFIGIGLVIALALARHAYFDPRNQYTTFSLPSICRLFVSRVGFYASVGAALFCAVLMTGSRGGILTGIIGGSLVLLMCLRRGGTPRAPAIAMLLGGVAISIALSVSALKNRTDASESTSVRLSLYGEALRAIADRPILGHGAGTYSSIQPIYHSASTPSNFIWDNVHSTVLEAALTLGIPAIIFGTGVLVYILLQLFDTWRNTSTEAICILVILAVSVAVALHAFVDFSLEIQAIALYVACLLGLGMGEKMSIDANRTIRDDSSTQLGAPPVCSPA
jgi:O-antigen ligase